MSDRLEKIIALPGELWSISAKIRGLSEILSMAKAEPPFSEEGLCGLSYLLNGIANEVEHIKDDIESFCNI